MRYFPLVLLVVLAGATGCRDKKPTYKRSTPVETINSFRKALEAGRIPVDSDDFFLGITEKTSWKLRCRERGCKRASLIINRVVSEDEYAAKYLVDVVVYGNGNRRVYQGKNTPITFSMHDGSWYFDQIGVVHKIQLGGPRDAGPAGGDAGPSSPADATR